MLSSAVVYLVLSGTVPEPLPKVENGQLVVSPTYEYNVQLQGDTIIVTAP